MNHLHKLLGHGKKLFILDYFFHVESLNIDLCVGDIMKDVAIARKTLDNILFALFSDGLLDVKRTVGKSKMYSLNKDDERIKMLRKLRMVIKK